MRKSIAYLCLVALLVVFTASDNNAYATKPYRPTGIPSTTPMKDDAPSMDINPSNRKSIYIPITTNPTEMNLIAVGTVKEIIKSTMIKLEDGKVFSLINVRIPILFDDQALKYLKENYIGKKVGVYQRDFPGVGHTDRLGNLCGHIVSDENVWMEADLILHGLAWADSTPKNRDLVTKLYQFETLARTNKSGFWASPSFATRNAKSLDDQINTFQVVEDTVKGVKFVGQMIYFNFGENPAKDFTVIMNSNLANYFKRPDGYTLNAGDWMGQRVRVRGWVKNQSGPMIEITHPEQVEFVGMEAHPHTINTIGGKVFKQ